MRSLIVWAWIVLSFSQPLAAGEWEVTPESERALERGLAWLARHQGALGDWNCDDLGLVSMGALAFLAAGHQPGRGRYGVVVDRALEAVLRRAKPTGLLNISSPRRDMYNHGMSTFVLGQAYGMSENPRLGRVLARALRLIAKTQCGDGGWGYVARRSATGHDLSLVVMQAKALRGAVDSGLEVPRDVTERAVECVRQYYRVDSRYKDAPRPDWKRYPGQFTYDGEQRTVAMAACGVLCLQEFGEYGDWRIPKSVDALRIAIAELGQSDPTPGAVPFDAYTLYYVSQALYQVGGSAWRSGYPVLRDALVASQDVDHSGPVEVGHWNAVQRVGGAAGDLYGTAVACFALAIPNRFLPILQRVGESAVSRSEPTSEAQLEDDEASAVPIGSEPELEADEAGPAEPDEPEGA